MDISLNVFKELILQFENNQNLTNWLSENNIPINSELIELIYDLQAGTYTEKASKADSHYPLFAQEVSLLLKPILRECSTLVDVGTGEANSLIEILKNIDFNLDAKAIDISYSRLSWAKANADLSQVEIEFSVGDMSCLPLKNNSIDLVMTVHALEPNGGKEKALIAELSRVAAKYLVLIEPDFSTASQEQQRRMESFGYILDIEKHFQENGLSIHTKTEIKNSANKSNVSTLWILKKSDIKLPLNGASAWVDPIFNHELSEFEGGLRSKVGLWFPSINGIPLLRKKDAQFVLRPYGD